MTEEHIPVSKLLTPKQLRKYIAAAAQYHSIGEAPPSPKSFLEILNAAAEAKKAREKIARAKKKLATQNTLPVKQSYSAPIKRHRAQRKTNSGSRGLPLDDEWFPGAIAPAPKGEKAF